MGLSWCVDKIRGAPEAVEAARAGAERELAAAEEYGDTGRTALYQDMLAMVRFAAGDPAAARPHLTAYLAAGQPWNAVRPGMLLARLALREGDPAAAERYLREAAEHGAGTAGPQERADLAALLVDSVGAQEDRAGDLVGVALAAAARWDGLSEPDTLHFTFIAAQAACRDGRYGEATALFEGVVDRVGVPYDALGQAHTRQSYGAALSELNRPREAAEQFLTAAALVQDDPESLPGRPEDELDETRRQLEAMLEQLRT